MLYSLIQSGGTAKDTARYVCHPSTLAFEKICITHGITLQLSEDNDGTYSIYANIPRFKAVRMMPQRTLTESLDKATVDKCINKIYDQVIANKDYCDLTEIQLGNSVEDALTDENK